MTKSNSSAKTGYRMPPKAIANLVDAPLTPEVNVSPDQNWILIMEQPPLPPISELAQPELKLAGLRINPRNNSSSRSSYFTKLTLKSLIDNAERPINELPSDARISSVTWSPDSRFIAFTNTCDSEIQLWLAEVDSGVARRLTDTRLSSAYGRPFCWLFDSQKLLCKAVPSDRGAAPEEPGVPDGPVIQESTGKKAPIRTYQDLLKNAHDEALLEHYLTTQVGIVSISGESRSIGSKGIIGQVEPSPDGCYIFVETIHRPFSYLAPIGRFPRQMEIWDMDGNVIYEVADLPMAEEIPVDFDAVRVGPRSIS
jgi:hypothetical protein